MNIRILLLLPIALVAALLLNGCETFSAAQMQPMKYDTRVLWVSLQNYVEKHPQMTHAQLSRVTVSDVVKSGQLEQSTVSSWQRRGFEISIHPENFRAPGDGVVCQINDRNSIVFATRTGEIKGATD